MAKLLSTTH